MSVRVDDIVTLTLLRYTIEMETTQYAITTEAICWAWLPPAAAFLLTMLPALCPTMDQSVLVSGSIVSLSTSNEVEKYTR